MLKHFDSLNNLEKLIDKYGSILGNSYQKLLSSISDTISNCTDSNTSTELLRIYNKILNIVSSNSCPNVNVNQVHVLV